MSVLSFFSRSSAAWNASNFSKPWKKDRQAIYAFINAHKKLGEYELSKEAENLPDEEILFKDKSVRWAPGALDGAFGHHADSNPEKEGPRKIFFTLKKLLNAPSKENIKFFYNLAIDDNVVDYIDHLLPMLTKDTNLDYERLKQFAAWLATESPDRGPVKVAIAILGIFPGEENKNIITTLGLHEEFTLYSAVALSNTLENPEMELWQLAKHVDGWGRIQIIECLSKTKNDDIMGWLLREGYKNSIMYEYLTYTCATTGDLLTALKNLNSDEALLNGAGDIIETLMIGIGGPCENMDDYGDGAAATKLYLSHIINKELELKRFLTIKAIRDYVNDDEANWEERERNGWTHKVRDEISSQTKNILERTSWKERALEGLKSEDEYQFHIAARVAKHLGIDTWQYFYTRQQSGGKDLWYYLMQTDDIEKIDNVLTLAQKTIPLEKVATGPAQEMGLGEEYQYHNALSFIVQDLRRFPGKGWDVIKVSLKSPIIRNRYMSLQALNQWGREHWPEDTEMVLKSALKIEPDADVKATIKKVIKGERID
jgi:hypothetical protein